MIDREKVINGLECHLKELSSGKTCFECPYCGDNPCEIQLMADALALLKEQEPKLVRIDEDSVHCPSCGNELFTYPRQRFCDECGQELKWDD